MQRAMVKVKQRVCMLVTMLMMLLLVSCQTTPSSDIVISKNDGRQYDNTFVPSSAQSGGKGIQDAGESTAIPFMPEILDIEIENGEVVQFQWSDILETGDIIKENVVLMPFASIMANIENQLIAKYAYLETFNETNALYIEKIILTYAVEPIKDSNGEYMLIPVWVFYGGGDYGEGQIMLDGNVREGRIARTKALLTVSAIDGSVIQGY